MESLINPSNSTIAVITSLPKNLQWGDDMKKWPKICDIHIFTYLLERKACDLKEMNSYKATQAYSYFLSECVGQILVAVDGDNRFLKAQVRPSQSVNESYNCWLASSENGIILTGGCICKAGESTVCSHVAAILYKVSYAHSKGLCGEESTDKQQVWNAGTSKNVFPSTISSTNFKKTKVNVDFEEFRSCNPTELPQAAKKLKSSQEFLSLVESSLMRAAFFVEGSIFNESFVKTRNIHKGSQNELDHLITVDESYGEVTHSEHSIELTEGSCAPCKEIYQQYISCSEVSSLRVSQKTKDQSLSLDPDLVLLWKITRKLRLTSSTAFKVPKRTTTNPSTFLKNHVFGSFIGNADTARGIAGEQMAKTKFAEITGTTVEKCGIFVSRSEPWLASSPDGIISRTTILEIKCPDPQKFDTYLSRRTYEIIKDCDNNYTLNKSKSYYQQVQLGLFCTETRSCMFMIYLGEEKHSIIFEVNIDLAYIQQEVKRLKKFYFEHLLPFLVDNLQKKNLIIPNIYKSILNE